MMAARLPPVADEPRTRLKQASLWSPTRLAILDAIHVEPGLCASEVARRIGRDPATVWTHLHLLRQAGLVTSDRVGRRVMLFAPGDVPAEDRLRAHLGAGMPVYDAIERGIPGRPMPIARACGMTRHAARYQLTRLVRLGFLRRVAARVLVTQQKFVVTETPRHPSVRT